MSSAILSLDRINKVFGTGDLSLHVLKDVSLDVEQGEFVSIMGPSGSGKSTLMNIIGTLDKPTSGAYVLEGEPVHELNERRIAQLRNESIGFVFQHFFLLARSNAVANVELPLIYAGRSRAERREIAERALDRVGLAAKHRSLPNQLSGGEKQRVAIARAISTGPKFILADEPTGALDTTTSAQIMELFRDLNADGTTIIMITHEQDIANCADRIVRIRDGRIESDERIRGRRVATAGDAEGVADAEPERAG
ncbi:ABC transporter ATP-binding protein [Granulicoccus sp. GXG6511]|uniref:ABC transporter ATP-binding protein n=1 Tax=Granulicoccus sp. GXG6511 TaxID=3381351 RepID=UPI003D7E59F1